MKIFAYLFVLVCVLTNLSGCAVANMLSQGYTPPPKVSLPTQNNEVQNDVTARTSRAISLSNYRGELVPQDMLESPVSSLPAYQDVGITPPSTLYANQYVHKSLADYAGQLAMALHQNMRQNEDALALGVVSFVNLDESLQTTSVLGNQLAEYMLTELHMLGAQTVDFKTRDQVSVSQRGDLIFSRTALDKASRIGLEGVLAGTIIEQAAGFEVNARIINIKSKQLLSAARVTIPKYVAEQSALGFVN